MYRTLIFVSIFFISIGLFAQEDVVPVKRSTNKVSIDGKKYYLHTVAKGETLYSICKAYNVDQKDIALDNPDIFNGIKPEQVLKIPIISGINSTEEEILSAGKYIVHKVEKGQTLYSIAKQYGIPVEQLQNENPDTKNGIKTGQLLRIPKENVDVKEPEKDQSTEKIEITGNDDKFIYYHVEKKQTLYSLSKKFDVGIDELIKFNPEIESGGLKEGQVIKIPKMSAEEAENYSDVKITSQKESDAKSENDNNTIKDNVDTAKINHPVNCTYNKLNRELNVALMLPLYLNKNKYLDVDKIVEEQSNFYPNTRYIEFYEGLLLAVDSLRKDSISINLNLYDTENDSSVVAGILKKPELCSMDLIIGPVYPAEIDLVSIFSKEFSIPFISPFIARSSITKSNPYAFSVMPDYATQIGKAALVIAEKYPRKNYVVIHNDNKDELEIIANYKKKLLDNFNLKENEIMYNEVCYKKSFMDGVNKVLRSDTLNVILVPSSDQAFVTDLITKLSLEAKKYRMIVVGLPTWKKYDNIELEYFHRLQLHTFTNAHVDYIMPSVKNFIKEYRFMFKAEPSNPYSFMGFDIGYYFIKGINMFGKSFVNCAENYKQTLLQTNMEFKRVASGGGFENQAVYIIKYNPDLSISKIN